MWSPYVVQFCRSALLGSGVSRSGQGWYRPERPLHSAVFLLKLACHICLTRSAAWGLAATGPPNTSSKPTKSLSPSRSFKWYEDRCSWLLSLLIQLSRWEKIGWHLRKMVLPLSYGQVWFCPRCSLETEGILWGLVGPKMNSNVFSFLARKAPTR